MWGLGFRVWGLRLGFRVSRCAAAVSTMWVMAPRHTQEVWGGGGAAYHAKAFVCNAVQQFSFVLGFFFPPAVSFYRPPPKPLPFRV